MRSNSMHAALVTMGAILTMASAAAAATIHVNDSTGDDSTGDGSSGSPYKTIQKGINMASSGDTVLVADGTYSGTGNKNLAFPDTDITLRSLGGPDNCKINCEGSLRAFYFDSEDPYRYVVEGFTVADGHASYGGAVYCAKGASAEFVNCRFLQNSADYNGGVVHCEDEGSPQFINCAFVENTADVHGGVLYAEEDSRPAFVNCLLADNECLGHGGTVYKKGFDELTMINCTVVNNTAATGAEGGFYITRGPATIKNCIVWGNSGDQIIVGLAYPPVDIDFNCVEGGYTGSNNISDDPQFWSTDHSNYHLTYGSPCLDSGDGNAVPASISTDYDGNDRVMDGDRDDTDAVDMGCYELTVIEPDAEAGEENDCRAAFNSALYAAADKWAVVFIEADEDKYYISGCLYVRSKTMLYGERSGSGVTLASNFSQATSPDHLLRIAGRHDVVVDGLTLEGGSMANYGIYAYTYNVPAENIVIRDCTIHSFEAEEGWAFAAGIFFAQTPRNVNIFDCVITDIVTDSSEEGVRGIAVDYDPDDGPVNIRIEGCTFERIRGADRAVDADSVWVHDAEESGAFGDVNVVIDDCTFANFGRRGVKLKCSLATVSNCTFTVDDDEQESHCAIGFFGEDTTITGNRITLRNCSAGIAGHGGTCPCEGNTIENNEIVVSLFADDDEPFKAAPESVGIVLEDVDDTLIAGNQIHAHYGVWLLADGSYSQDNEFEDNYFNVNEFAKISGGAGATYTSSGDAFPWDAEEDYAVDDVVLYGAAPTVYECIQAATGGELPTNTGYWDNLGALTWFNLPPTADVSADPTSGSAGQNGLPVSFDATGSTDPEDDTLTYKWDFDDQSAEGSGATPTHTFTSAGTYTVTLMVDDGNGGAGLATVEINVQ